MLARCKHVNIIRYREAFVHQGVLNIAMEFADGGLLYVLAKKNLRCNYVWGLLRLYTLIINDDKVYAHRLAYLLALYWLQLYRYEFKLSTTAAKFNTLYS